MKIGLMGGTFDPIHIGHLFLAEEVANLYALDKIIFLPSGHGPHKDVNRVSDPHIRYEMVEKAIQDHPLFVVSDIETQRTGLSFTIDTIRHFKDLYPEDQLFFITGADAILTIETWREFESLLSACTFVAATRPSIRSKALIEAVKALNQKYHASIQLMDMPQLEISSSDIRKRVRMGRTVRYLVPEVVREMIRCRGLYED